MIRWFKKPEQAKARGFPPKTLGCKLAYSEEKNRQIIADLMAQYPHARGIILRKVSALQWYWAKYNRPLADRLYTFACELAK